MKGIIRFIDNRTMLPRMGFIDDGEIRVMEQTYLEGISYTGEVIGTDRIGRFLPPVAAPSKIIGIGFNYRDHAEEINAPIPSEPLIFMKAPSSMIAHEDVIFKPGVSNRVDYEAELALVIDRKVSNISETQALACVSGYTCANDVTARDLQASDVQYVRSKSFDTFCPLGPVLITDVNPGDLGIQARLNGRVVQNSRTSQLIFSPSKLISYVSRMMTLYPGDIILTGTPAGIGPMIDGDVIEVEIEGIGVLKNKVSFF